MSDLLALSDVLVLRALERSYSRGLTGEHRRVAADARHLPRHRAYEEIQIPPMRHARALEDAWTITAELVSSWQLAVAAPEWAAALDGYCRDLLTTRRPRSLADLERALDRVGVRHGV